MATKGTLGFECVLTLGGNTVGRAKDVTGPSASADAVDVTTRTGVGWKEFKSGLKEWEANVDQLWVPDDVALEALIDAFLTGTELAASFVDGSGNGFTGTCIVISMELGQPLGDAVAFPIGLKGTGALAKAGGYS